jgi:hypothetical protein
LSDERFRWYSSSSAGVKLNPRKFQLAFFGGASAVVCRDNGITKAYKPSRYLISLIHNNNGRKW